MADDMMDKDPASAQTGSAEAHIAPADVRAAQGSAVMRSFHKAATSLVAGYEKSPLPRHLRGERPKPSAVPPALDRTCPAHKRERH